VRNALIFGGLVLALAVPNVAIVQKERLLATGTPMLIELAPVDPRSLIQGDYMRLDYAIARELAGRAQWPRDGQLVVRLDDNGVAQVARRHDGAPLGPREHLLRYRKRGSRVGIGSNAFFFQEGHANRYVGARYGELRVDRDGASVLVGLRDSTRRALAP
jgi:uncharacterized membrane-anchored protein